MELDYDSFLETEAKDKPSWWLKIEEEYNNKPLSSLKSKYGTELQLANYYEPIVKETLVLSKVLDTICYDDNELAVSKHNLRKQISESISVVPEFWLLPPTLIFKPRTWKEKSNEIYIGFPYYIEKETDYLPVRIPIKSRKKYQVAELFNEGAEKHKKPKTASEFAVEKQELEKENARSKIPAAAIFKSNLEEPIVSAPAKKFIEVNAANKAAVARKKISIKKLTTMTAGAKKFVFKAKNIE